MPTPTGDAARPLGALDGEAKWHPTRPPTPPLMPLPRQYLLCPTQSTPEPVQRQRLPNSSGRGSRAFRNAACAPAKTGRWQLVLCSAKGVGYGGRILVAKTFKLSAFADAAKHSTSSETLASTRAQHSLAYMSTHEISDHCLHTLTQSRRHKWDPTTISLINQGSSALL